MIRKIIHGLAVVPFGAAAFFASCSDNANDPIPALSEYSSNSETVLSSSEMDDSNSESLSSNSQSKGSSSSEVSSSSAKTPSSSANVQSSSAKAQSSSAKDSSASAQGSSSSATTTVNSSTAKNSSSSTATSSNTTPSSSAGAKSAGSNGNSSIFEPVVRSSSSYSKLRNEPEDERHKIYRLLYPVENGALDTGYFDQGDCEILSDGSFACRQKSCVEYVGGYISLHSEGIFPGDGSEKHAQYFRGSTDETRLIDINLGDSALTSYIPYADIPEFDIDDIKSKLSTLPAATCTTLIQFVSNYKMSASGLPEGFVLHLDANFALKPSERVTEPYSMVFPKEELDTVKANISTNENRIAHGYTLFNEIQYAKETLFSKSSIEYNTYVSDQGCGIVAHTYNPMPSGMAGLCQGWIIPERARNFSVRLINTSDKTPASFTWKLTYMDQFGRGNTIDITTQLR
jgi:CCR4-NOT transcriptional regulation complex, NOT5 subunit